MNSKEIIETTKQHLLPIMNEINGEIFDIEYLKEGPNLVLRIYIDKEEGVKIEDCEIVSRYIEKILDEKDYIKDQYMLEVSSPGIDRPLKKDSDFEKYKGEIVDIKLYKSINKLKEFSGELLKLENNEIHIKTEEEILTFNRNDVAMCRLAINI